MSDVFNPAKRSEIMSKVHSANTAPEIRIRKLLHSMGYRFRINRKDLPGKPDIVLPKYKTLIFVHGCFWHGCPTCKHAQIRPKSNSDYWAKKLDRTLERDQKNIDLLEKIGWKVIVIWECEIKQKNLEQIKAKIESLLPR